MAIVTYFRSSSYGTWDFCNLKYVLDYTLGFRSPANQKAEKGSLTHKMLELLAGKKLAMQNGEPTFSDGEIGKTYDTATFDPEMAAQEAWQHYTVTHPSEYEGKVLYEWCDQDFIECRQWMYDVMAYKGGMFNPLNREVIWPEKYFDFTIEKPWAAYSYDDPYNGKKLEGYLALKGTVDLVCRMQNFPDVVEMVDWKTGACKNWVTGVRKTWKSLRDDPQLRIYHYAISRLLPEVDEIFVTIVFMNDGGAFSLPFCRDDLAKTEQMIEKRFNTIRNCHRPRRIWGDRNVWQSYVKCNNWCHFGKNKQPGTTKTMCQYYKDEIVQLGLERVMKKHGKPEALSSYGEGGGRSGT